MRYAPVPLSPRDKGRGDDDPRPVGAPEPFWRWSVGSANKLLEAHAKKVLHPHQFAIGVSSGAEKMGKLTSFEAAQLSEHAWVIPDVKNAYCELDREETVSDCCEWHPLAGALVIALYTVPTVHDNKGAPSATIYHCGRCYSRMWFWHDRLLRCTEKACGVDYEDRRGSRTWSRGFARLHL